MLRDTGTEGDTWRHVFSTPLAATEMVMAKTPVVSGTKGQAEGGAVRTGEPRGLGRASLRHTGKRVGTRRGPEAGCVFLSACPGRGNTNLSAPKHLLCAQHFLCDLFFNLRSKRLNFSRDHGPGCTSGANPMCSSHYKNLSSHTQDSEKRDSSLTGG